MEHDDELGQDHEDFDTLDLEEDSKPEDAAPSGNANQQSRSDGLSATQADLALLEAAMSSAVHHPNVVQTYHYRTLQPDIGASIGSGRITRVEYKLLSGSPSPRDCQNFFTEGGFGLQLLDRAAWKLVIKKNNLPRGSGWN